MGNPVLTVENLAKSYHVRKGPRIQAVDNISFEVNKGEIFGLLGPNGAGKTTTVKMICSLIRPDAGRVLIGGFDHFRQRGQALGKISAVLEGNRNIYWPLTVRENLEFFAALKGRHPREVREDIALYIDLFGLRDKANETARRLSRGMQQKLAIATAMVSGMEVVLLDEPTLGLDVQASFETRALLRSLAEEHGRTIILTTHDMNVVQETCQRVVIINNGRIVAQDTVPNLMQLFQVKSYRFKISGTLSAEMTEALQRIPHLEQENGPEGTLLSVSLEDPGVFYRVTEILSRENMVIESIERQEINFERVFLEILGRSA